MRKVAKQSLDKSSRFTDWSRRPLTDAQKTYALADVTHLRVIYEKLAAKLAKNKRAHWVEEELQTLTNPETYITRPEEAWKRVKTRTNSARMLGIVRALAEFREAHAQSNNIPRNRVFKDDALIELASTKPQSFDDLQRSRLLLREARKGDIAKGILAAVASALALQPEYLPQVDKKEDAPDSNPALSEMLRVLLKAKTEHLGVAAKLVASASDLDAMAAGERNLDMLRGWRSEVFGDEAKRLCQGEIGLVAKGRVVTTFELPI